MTTNSPQPGETPIERRRTPLSLPKAEDKISNIRPLIEAFREIFQKYLESSQALNVRKKIEQESFSVPDSPHRLQNKDIVEQWILKSIVKILGLIPDLKNGRLSNTIKQVVRNVLAIVGSFDLDYIWKNDDMGEDLESFRKVIKDLLETKQ